MVLAYWSGTYYLLEFAKILGIELTLSGCAEVARPRRIGSNWVRSGPVWGSGIGLVSPYSAKSRFLGISTIMGPQTRFPGFSRNRAWAPNPGIPGPQAPGPRPRPPAGGGLARGLGVPYRPLLKCG